MFCNLLSETSRGPLGAPNSKTFKGLRDLKKKKPAMFEPVFLWAKIDQGLMTGLDLSPVSQPARCTLFTSVGSELFVSSIARCHP